MVDVGVTRIERRGRLSGTELDAVTRLVDGATEHDGVRPLSEHVTLHLRYGGDEPARNLLAYDDGGRLVGYAHLDVTDPVEGPSAELTVAPDARGRGHGRSLVEALVADSPDGRLRLWAHGEHPAAAALARSMGFTGERRLLQLRRSLYAPVPEATLPAGIAVRTFEVGADEAAWVEVNNRAFAEHPEQGGWTLDDIRTREREPWFDPAGFFLAERREDGAGGAQAEGPGYRATTRLVGFHWTKVHGATRGGLGGAAPESDGAGAGGAHEHEPIGEVYVVGVDPAEQGGGLGRALTVVGLRHLRARGLAQAMLYVDESNAGAVHVYESLGFTRWDADVRFARHPTMA
jgi:mycothiol synthase